MSALAAVQIEVLAPISEAPVRVEPVAAAGDDPRLLPYQDEESPQAAAYRVMRHRIDAWAQGERAVIALCAPRAGQGATTAAANLALALSECGRAEVCLIEGNLRRPALAAALGFKPPECLRERLGRRGKQPQAPFRVAEVRPGLHVMACDSQGAGRAPADLHGLVALVHAAREAGYRYVVIDAPPVLGSADANVIEEMVDVVVLVTRAGLTTASDLRGAADQLGRRKVLGAVLLDE